MTYYFASLLPTKLIDTFFALRQRLLKAHLSRNGNFQALAAAAQRRPLPQPPSLASDSSGFRTQPTSRTSSESGSSEGEPLMQESDTILPAFAPSAAASTQPSQTSSAPDSPNRVPRSDNGENPDRDREGRLSASEHIARSTTLGESYVQV